MHTFTLPSGNRVNIRKIARAMMSTTPTPVSFINTTTGEIVEKTDFDEIEEFYDTHLEETSSLVPIATNSYICRYFMCLEYILSLKPQDHEDEKEILVSALHTLDISGWKGLYDYFKHTDHKKYLELIKFIQKAAEEEAVEWLTETFRTGSVSADQRCKNCEACRLTQEGECGNFTKLLAAMSMQKNMSGLKSKET